MYRLFVDDGADAAPTLGVFLRPALSESRNARPRSWLMAREHEFADPFRHGAMEPMATLTHAPTGCSTTGRSAISCAACSPPPGAPTIALRHKLFLVATNITPAHPYLRRPRARPRADLDGDRSVRGTPRPFPPVSIGGEYYVDGALNKTLNASVALDEAWTCCA
jgi:hypothetical protein